MALDDWKMDCAICGRHEDQRSMEVVDNQHGGHVWICRSCDGDYDNEELLEIIEDLQND